MTFTPARKPSSDLRTRMILWITLPFLIILALWVSMNPTLAAETHKPVPVLSVSGTGTVNAEPDIAYISSGVVSEAKSAEKALAENNKKMASIFDVLEKSGIERKHIRTSNFSVHPRYNRYRPKPGEVQKPPKIVGYTVNNTVTVKVTDLAKLGKTITEVVQFGSNQLGNIRFDLSNKQELLDQARAAAVLDAKRKAEIYTATAGVKIGRLLSLSEGNVSLPRPHQKAFARTAALEAAPTPVSGGEQQLTFSVAITWEIDQ